ncbi:ATP-binding protein [candidate division CSSED10-310 bacterium]|uniref:ATP-binding protein n=1 Tax=candidate division CSSED10-310 bacterium TaxID=2855610 RepID=A0ABV6YXE4_UNCC1
MRKRRMLGHSLDRCSADWLNELPSRPVCFETHDQLCSNAAYMFHARKQLVDYNCYPDDKNTDYVLLKNATVAWTKYWHDSLKKTGKSLLLCQIFGKHRLNRLEKEIVTALLLEQLGLLDFRSINCQTMIEILALSLDKTITVLRSVSEESRLLRSGLISYSDPDEDLKERELIIDPYLVDTIVFDRKKETRGLPVHCEEDLEQYICRFTLIARKKMCEFQSCFLRGHGDLKDMYKRSRAMDRFHCSLLQTLQVNRQWRLSKIQRHMNSSCEWLIFLILLGKERGYIEADDELFTGHGLAAAVADDLTGYHQNLKQFQTNGFLVKNEYIQPCGGPDPLIMDNPEDLKEVEFELTDSSLAKLELLKKTKKRKYSHFSVRKAVHKLDQVVLTPEVRKSLEMVFAQIKRKNQLLVDWGLGKVMPYGRGVTLLFSGPPGTGKTATAEAIAGELNTSLLVADYSRIQNCLVGQTEKNIVRVFQEARVQESVLLWDEADAMFFDRNQASRSWEVRDVNVLLQEIERFEGICILTTNRSVHLDKALERRMSLKLTFPMPDKNIRLQIWRKLLPKNLPLAKECSLERLSSHELSGGEIKNVVLNAARLALSRNNDKIHMVEFTEVITLEKSGKLRHQQRRTAGFCSGVSHKKIQENN